MVTNVEKLILGTNYSTIEKGVESIGAYAFTFRDKISNVVMPSTVKYMEVGTFGLCTNLRNVKFSEQLEFIEISCFNGCSNLKELVLTDSIVLLGNNAFASCTNLERIYIGSGLHYFVSPTHDGSSFEGCNKIKYIEVSELNPCYDSRNNCNAIIRTETNDLLLGSSNTIIPNDVVELANYCFNKNELLRIIKIPDSVTVIGYAFRGCINLQYVNFGSGITTLGEYYFQNCPLKEIHIPAEMTNIAIMSFSTNETEYMSVDENNPIYYSVEGCNAILKRYNSLSNPIPGDILYIGCPNTVIPNNIRHLEVCSFAYLTNLYEITIPSSVTHIWADAFKGCTNLSLIYCEGNIAPALKSRFSDVEENGILVTPEGSDYSEWLKYLPSGWSIKHVVSDYDLLCVFNTKDVTFSTAVNEDFLENISKMYVNDVEVKVSNYIIFENDGENVVKYKFIDNTIIHWGAFFSCDELVSVEISDNIITISDKAFDSCSGVTSITIGNSVTSIGSSAFTSCYSLTSITIPDSVTSIGSHAFEYCTNLTSIEIPDSVTSIGSEVFGGCNNLESITVSENNPYYDSRENCNAIIETATNTLKQGCKNTIIVDSVTSIGSHAFAKCDSLTSIIILDSVTSIGSNAFAKCDSLTSITIPDSVTSISERTFISCYSLTSITIPNSVTSIGEAAFNGCTSLTSIEIPDSVTSIDNYAFNICSGVTSITIGNSVTSIGSNAFARLTNLSFIYCSAKNAPSIKNNSTFYLAKKHGVLQHPKDSDYSYWLEQLGSGWEYTNDCSNLTFLINVKNANTSVNLISSDTTLSNCKSMYIDSNEIEPTMNYYFESSGIYKIKYEFIDNKKITGWGAFMQVDTLRVLIIPETITYIDERAFDGCDDLQNIIVNENNIVFDSRDNCNAIVKTESNTIIKGCKNTVITNTITNIGEYAFNGCNGLTSINIPDSVITIGEYSFSYCDNLEYVTIGNGTTTIIDSAFMNSYKIKKVVFGKNVNEIGLYCFASCKNLNELAFNSILCPDCASYCFYDLPKTGTLYYPQGSDYSTVKSALPSDWTYVEFEVPTEE